MCRYVTLCDLTRLAFTQEGPLGQQEHQWSQIMSNRWIKRKRSVTTDPDVSEKENVGNHFPPERVDRLQYELLLSLLLTVVYPFSKRAS